MDNNVVYIFNEAMFSKDGGLSSESTPYGTEAEAEAAFKERRDAILKTLKEAEYDVVDVLDVALKHQGKDFTDNLPKKVFAAIEMNFGNSFKVALVDGNNMNDLIPEQIGLAYSISYYEKCYYKTTE